MATSTAMEYRTPATSRPIRTRALSVGGAIVAAVAVWVVAVPLLGLHLVVRFGSGAPQTIAVGFVVGATLIASLAAWGLLALLERRTAARSVDLDRRRGRRIDRLAGAAAQRRHDHHVEDRPRHHARCGRCCPDPRPARGIILHRFLSSRSSATRS